MERKLFCSSNGFEFLEHYLTEIYGERGSIKHNLERYIYGEFFQAGCRYVNTIDDLPEITFEEIKRLIEKENYFRTMSIELQKKYDELNKSEKLTDEDYREVAGIMGLAPGHTDRLNTLFPNILDLYVSSKEEGDKIWESVCSNANVVAAMVNAMMDYIRSNQIINYNGRDMLSQGYARNYFRGESAYYKTSKSSMFRGLDTVDENEAEVLLLIRIIKVIDFSIWLSKLDCVNDWRHGDVFHSAIAQHYGIATNGMDVSSNLKIALFFACCHFDKNTQKWLPLKNSDFEKADSRSSVAKMNGDSRYGILYCAPADIAELSRVVNCKDIHITNVTPVGIQPFQRCERQSAYLIETAQTYDMLKDRSFTKVKFKLNQEICEWIYHEMKEGDLVYPNEGNGSCQDIADAVSNSKVHTKEAFDCAIDSLGINESRKSELRDKINSKGYTILDKIQWCTPERQKELENNCFESTKDIESSFRLMFCI